MKKTSEHNPLSLLKYNRFDIPAKTLYVKFRERKYNSIWGTEIYKEHLNIWNGFSEILNCGKDSFYKFIYEFDSIIDSMKVNGFLKDYPIILNDNEMVINGSHRLSSSIYFNINVFSRISDNSDKEGQWKCFYDFFKNRSKYPSENNKTLNNLDIKYLDAMACEYCELKKNTYVIILYPSVQFNDIVEKTILRKCDIVYKKEINLNKFGLFNLIKHIYFGMEWIGHWDNMFNGICEKLKFCYSQLNQTIAYLVESDSLENIIDIKKSIREIYKIDNHSCHTTDNHYDSLNLARALFNNNSIHFLNNSLQKNFKNFNCFFSEYKKRINVKNEDDFCVVGSSVLGLYGIRDVEDLDFLHSDDFIFCETNGISSHNKEIKYYKKSKDDIIHNPQNYFWYEGVKFCSLDTIIDMKKNRKEKKDLDDLELIERYEL